MFLIYKVIILHNKFPIKCYQKFMLKKKQLYRKNKRDEQKKIINLLILALCSLENLLYLLPSVQFNLFADK